MMRLGISPGILPGDVAAMVRRYATGHYPNWLSDRSLETIVGLIDTPCEQSALEDVLIEENEENALPFFLHLLQWLAEEGVLERQVSLHDKVLARLTAPLALEPLASKLWEDQTGFTVSRFGFITHDRGIWIVQNAIAKGRLSLLGKEGLDLLYLVGQANVFGDIVGAMTGACPREVVIELLVLLRALGVIVIKEFAGATNTGSALKRWSFHDALFHCRSRGGRTDSKLGKTIGIVSEASQPQRRPVNGTYVPLYRPPSRPSCDRDESLVGVMERRRSVRRYGPNPITLKQLGEFLYRVARAKPRRAENNERGQFVKKTYPSGGGLYELEVYLVVNRCEGLSPGLYRYNSVEHQLHHLSGLNTACEKLLAQARASFGQRHFPDILFCLAARFDAVLSIYHGIAYALILKNAGALIQSMYLVATEMNLAPCALGGGNVVDFLEATGFLPFEEESVAEFALGSMPLA